MSNAYAAWLFEVLPNAEIVYDHFHVIKLMNERMDVLRRTMNKLAEEQKKELKGKRCLFLRNHERLNPEAARELKKLRFEYEDLGTASLMKEYLRNIYTFWKHDRITNASQEGFNNKIGWLIRQAYGYRVE